VYLYTGALSDSNGPAGTYLEFMRYDVSQIVNGLK
jgi:ABC-type Zn uptake system ZnuABC Zn-binding protein ZnuA